MGEAKEFLIDWYEKLLEDVDSGAQAARKVISAFGAVARSPASISTRRILRFFTTKRRSCFISDTISLSIKIDSACYNFIASEASSVSFMAILKGDVSQKHWFYLYDRKLAVPGQFAFLGFVGRILV